MPYRRSQQLFLTVQLLQKDMTLAPQPSLPRVPPPRPLNRRQHASGNLLECKAALGNDSGEGDEDTPLLEHVCQGRTTPVRGEGRAACKPRAERAEVPYCHCAFA